MNLIARKALTLMATVALGLVSLGLAIADDPKPIIPPVSTPNPPSSYPPATPYPTPPVMPMRAVSAPELPTVEKQVQGLAHHLKQGEKQVSISLSCLEMTADFASEIGLTADRPKNMESSSLLVTFLNRREGKMLEALIRARQSGEVDVFARPQLIVSDGKSGFFQCGAQVPQPAPFEPSPNNGKAVPPPTLLNVGITMKVTPTISKDNGSIHLKLEPQSARVVDLGNAVDNLALPVPPKTPEHAQGVELSAKQGVENPQATVFESVQLTTSVVLPTGGTVVIGKKSEANTLIQTKNLETGTIVTERVTTSRLFLWVITANAIVGKP